MLRLRELLFIEVGIFVWLSVSKAFEKSTAITTVRGGFYWLKSSSMFRLRRSRVEAVDLFLRKPYWVSPSGRSATSSRRVRHSRTFVA